MPIPLVAIGTVIAECVKPFFNPMTWPALGLVAVLSWCQGRDYEDDRWRARIAKEKAEQAEAIRKQDEETFRVIDRLVSDKEQRNARIQKLLAELRASGKLGRGALSPDVVRAINRALSGRP